MLGISSANDRRISGGNILSILLIEKRCVMQPNRSRSGVNVLKRNSVRLAEVWLDEYKEYYYERINHQLVSIRGPQRPDISLSKPSKRNWIEFQSLKHL